MIVSHNHKPESSETISSSKLFPYSLQIDTFVPSECQIMQAVSKHGLCPPVYAKYKNGLVYGFTEGVTVTGELMLTKDFETEMAAKLARFHSIKYEVPGTQYRTHLERLEQQFGPPFRGNLI